MFQSACRVNIPETDILSWAFGSNDIEDDRPIWIDAHDSTKVIDYQTAKQSVRQLIRGLRHHGLEKGDTVCVHSFNDVWYPVVYLATVGAQGCFVGSNPAYKELELRRLLLSSNPKFMIVDSQQLDNVWSTIISVGINPKGVFLFDEQRLVQGPVGLTSWKVLLSYGDEDWCTFHSPDEARKTPAVQLSTSGTSGLPKIAVMSHYAILAQATSAAYTIEGCSENIRRLISLPFFHSFVLPFHLLALRRGDTTFVMRRFDAEDYATFIEKYSITMIPLVPPIASKIFAPSVLNRHDFSSLRNIACAGAPLGMETQATMVRRLHSRVNFCQLWGLSELGWITAFKHNEIDDTGSVGRLLPNVESKIVDTNDIEVQSRAQAGEILVKSPGVMLGYMDDKVTSPLNGWFRTGDIGYCNDDKWYIIDRAKDMIKVRAWQVSPAEVEACIHLLPEVRDVAVVGISAGIEIGETPIAFVVVDDSRKDRTALDLSVQAIVKEKLASYKAIGRVMFVDHIPRTVSGKILRRVLQESIGHQ